MTIVAACIVAVLAVALLAMRMEEGALARKVEAARQRSLIDPETGLPSAAMLVERLDAELHRARRFDHGMRAMVMEFDRRDGMQAVGAELLDCCRFPTQAARLDERRIVVLVPECSTAEQSWNDLAALLARRSRDMRVGGLTLDQTTFEPETLVDHMRHVDLHELVEAPLPGHVAA
jgi:GGDEF domain-containing protein